MKCDAFERSTIIIDNYTQYNNLTTTQEYAFIAAITKDINTEKSINIWYYKITVA